MFIEVVGERSVSVLTYCFLLVRKSNTNSWGLSKMLCSVNLLIRMCGCMVLKAKEQSMNRYMACFDPESR